MKKKKRNIVQLSVKVVYGFLHKLKIVVIGEMISGKIEDAMWVQVEFEGGTIAGEWEILEVLHMDFINQHENPHFKGLILKCKTEEDFKLLQSLRVYDETINIISK